MIIGCRPAGLFASYFPLASRAADERKQRAEQVSATVSAPVSVAACRTARGQYCWQNIQLLAHQLTAFK